MVVWLHNHSYGKTVLARELEVALVVAGNTHDRTRAVFAEHEVRNPDRHGLLGERIHHEAAGVEAFLLDFAGHSRGAILRAERRCLRSKSSGIPRLSRKPFDQRMLRSEEHEIRPVNCVNPGRKHFDRLICSRSSAPNRYDRELHARAR